MMQIINEQIELTKSIVRKIDNQILETIVRENEEIDVDDLQEIKNANLSLAKGKKYVLIVNSMEFSSITKKARELSASKDFAQDTLAKALIINSLGQKLVINFYIAINKPHILTKAFTDREKALEWLKLQLNQHNIKNT